MLLKLNDIVVVRSILGNMENNTSLPQLPSESSSFPKSAYDECYESLIRIVTCYDLSGIVQKGYRVPSTVHTDREVNLQRLAYNNDKLVYCTQLMSYIDEEIIYKSNNVIEKLHHLLLQIALLDDVNEQERQFYFHHLTHKLVIAEPNWRYHVKSLEEFVIVKFENINFYEAFKRYISNNLKQRDLDGINYLLKDRLNGMKLDRFSFLGQLIEWKEISILNLGFLIYLLDAIDRHDLKINVENYVKKLKRL